MIMDKNELLQSDDAQRLNEEKKQLSIGCFTL